VRPGRHTGGGGRGKAVLQAPAVAARHQRQGQGDGPVRGCTGVDGARCGCRRRAPAHTTPGCGGRAGLRRSVTECTGGGGGRRPACAQRAPAHRLAGRLPAVPPYAVAGAVASLGRHLAAVRRAASACCPMLPRVPPRARACSVAPACTSRAPGDAACVSSTQRALA
jgi:hypothetical protein